MQGEGSAKHPHVRSQWEASFQVSCVKTLWIMLSLFSDPRLHLGGMDGKGRENLVLMIYL